MALYKKIAIILVLGALLSLFVLGRTILSIGAETAALFRHGDVLFVGDIMLARSVERVMYENGYEHPYQKVRTLHSEYDYVVGNFEGTIPRVHSPTAPMTFAFSVEKEAIPALYDSGIRYVSLANNHALDFDEPALEHTRKVLIDEGISPFGDPARVSDLSSTVIEAGGKSIALIGIHAVWKAPHQRELEEVFQELQQSTDFQIVYIHWGAEYELVHNDAQEKLAETLVELGADTIIGHHPHVAQDVGMIDGVPVFYSLGNYIFDQYWNDDVQQGFALGMDEERGTLSFSIIPIESVRSVPRLMTGDTKTDFLRSLARRSDQSVASDIARGKVRLK